MAFPVPDSRRAHHRDVPTFFTALTVAGRRRFSVTEAVAAVTTLRELLARGGTEVATGEGPALRTVVQLDGDVLCFVDEQRTSADSTLWPAHAAAVTVAFGRIASSVSTVIGAIRPVAATLAIAGPATLAIAIDQLAAALITVLIAGAGTVALKLERAARRSASLAARITLRVVTAAAVTAALAVTVAVGRPQDVFYLVAGTVSGLVVAWGLHWLLRHMLRPGGLPS